LSRASQTSLELATGSRSRSLTTEGYRSIGAVVALPLEPPPSKVPC
jgi:hypothetical protein